MAEGLYTCKRCGSVYTEPGTCANQHPRVTLTAIVPSGSGPVVTPRTQPSLAGLVRRTSQTTPEAKRDQEVNNATIRAYFADRGSR